MPAAALETTPTLILHVPWMVNYRGLVGGDKPLGHFGYNRSGEEGPEIFNFHDQRGRVYGYSPVRMGTINITKLGASREDETITGATVIWTASWPGIKGLRWIVGWYKNATIYRSVQSRPKAKHVREQKHVHYNVSASEADVRLLTLDERTFSFQPTVLGRPGHAPAFFLSASNDIEWRKKIQRFISGNAAPLTVPPSTKSTSRGGGWQHDLELRLKTERRTVEIVEAHYTALGFDVVSCESVHVGWDLNVTKGDLHIRAEVKGVSGTQLFCELTPNEYEKMQSKDIKPYYRLCVVNDPLVAHHKLRIFSYSAFSDQCVTEDGESLQVQLRTGARCSL